MENTGMYQFVSGLVFNYFSIDFIMPGSPFNIGGFPIMGFEGEYGEYIPLTRTTRIFLSVLWYGFLLAILATIPLRIAKVFKNEIFYKNYKIFWWFGAFIFTSLTAVLTGITPFSDTRIINFGLILFIIFYFLTSCLVLLPAYLQNSQYNDS